MSEQRALFAGDHSRRVPPMLWTRATRFLRRPPQVHEADGGWRPLLGAVASALVAAGLFTLSWDRLLNVQAAGYNLKLPALLFSLAAVAALVAVRQPVSVLLEPGARRTVMVLVGVIVVYELVRGVFSASPIAAVAQVLAILSGAVLPAVAVLLVVRRRADLRWALAWAILGAAVAAVFGLYQLLAFYVGWPQGVPYTGVGIGTSIGRISAFNYEPAYFAYFVVLIIGAVVAGRRLDGREVGWWAVVAFGLILYLANVRAAPLVVVAMGALLALTFQRNRALLIRGAIVLTAVVALALVTPTLVTSVTSAVSAARPQTPPAADRPSPSLEARSAADQADVEEEPASQLHAQLQSVNPAEQSSNAPRLGLYTAVLHQVAGSPVFGVGAGNLGAALQRDAPSTIQDQIGGQVVANNIWLQALADGGVVQLLLELALLGTVMVAAVRRRTSSMYPLAAAWLAVVLVGGMLTSYFFDIKVWVVLALLLVGLAVAPPADSSKRIEAAA